MLRFSSGSVPVSPPDDLALRALGLLLMLLGGALSGCVQTSTLPARQLESGETVASGGLNGPVPLGLVGQVTTRVGRGDLSANLGVGSTYLSGGLAGRYYLHERLNGEAQVRVGGNREFAALLAVGGLQTVPSDGMPLYVGVHAGTRSWIAGNPSEETSERVALPGEGLDPIVGGSVGVGPFDLGAGWRLQLELEATANLGRDAAGGEVNLLPAPNRLSIGLFRSLGSGEDGT